MVRTPIVIGPGTCQWGSRLSEQQYEQEEQMLQRTLRGVKESMLSLKVCGGVGGAGVYHVHLPLLDIFWFHYQMLILS